MPCQLRCLVTTTIHILSSADVLTSDGAKALLEDPTAAHFPWGLATVGMTAGHAPKSELSTEQMIARAKQLAAEVRSLRLAVGIMPLGRTG
jgi:hypothetical protein